MYRLYNKSVELSRENRKLYRILLYAYLRIISFCVVSSSSMNLVLNPPTRTISPPYASGSFCAAIMSSLDAVVICAICPPSIMYEYISASTFARCSSVAVVYVGEDLDVLLELADRILVLCGGKVSGIVPGRGAKKRDVGMMMTRLGGKSEDE